MRMLLFDRREALQFRYRRALILYLSVALFGRSAGRELRAPNAGAEARSGTATATKKPRSIVRSNGACPP